MGSWLGACEAGLSVGMLMGSLGVSTALASRLGRFRTSVGSIFCEGLGLVLIGLARSPWALVPLQCGVGLCISNVSLVGQTHRMLAILPGYRAFLNLPHDQASGSRAHAPGAVPLKLGGQTT